MPLLMSKQSIKTQIWNLLVSNAKAFRALKILTFLNFPQVSTLKLLFWLKYNLISYALNTTSWRSPWRPNPDGFNFRRFERHSEFCGRIQPQVPGETESINGNVPNLPPNLRREKSTENHAEAGESLTLFMNVFLTENLKWLLKKIFEEKEVKPQWLKGG